MQCYVIFGIWEQNVGIGCRIRRPMSMLSIAMLSSWLTVAFVVKLSF